jgi:hypothetical protein
MGAAVRQCPRHIDDQDGDEVCLGNADRDAVHRLDLGANHQQMPEIDPQSRHSRCEQGSRRIYEGTPGTAHWLLVKRLLVKRLLVKRLLVKRLLAEEALLSGAAGAQRKRRRCSTRALHLQLRDTAVG